MGVESLDEQLRFYIANSLAWTGQTKAAAQAYLGLTATKYKAEGQVGLANLARWQGKDMEASRLFSEVLRENPKNADALDGARLAQRELRPRTIITGGRSKDSSDVATRSLGVTHRWRSQSQLEIFEVEGAGVGAENPRIDVRRPELTLRYRGVERDYKPTAEISTNGQTVLGSASAEFGSLPLVMEVGRIDWGRTTNNPNAMANTLTANRFSVRASTDAKLGNIFARADSYSVSDGNRVVTTALRYTPSWRPLGPNFKPLLGIETRSAKFNTLNYWSPTDGFGSLSAGILGEWSAGSWSFYSSAQRGWPLFGEAGAGWSLSAAGKRWIADDTAVGLNYWAMISRRDGVPYRARSLFLTAEHIWQ